MQILQKPCDPDQPIHLHCFTGDGELVKKWTVFRMFSLDSQVPWSFGIDQIDGLYAVPMNRMLLDTDSPYMKPGGGYINTPAVTGDVVTIVASK